MKNKNFFVTLFAIGKRVREALCRANETVPDTGIEPDYYVPDGYSTLKRDLGNWEEPLLHCALNLIGGSTPVTRQSMIPGKDYTSLLTPIGEPSYVTEYHLKHHRYED